MKIVDVTGQRFGKLVVTAMSRETGQKARVVCTCDCGTVGFTATMSNVRTGNTQSCGCVAIATRSKSGKRMGPVNGAGNITHGHAAGTARSKTYVSWLDAKKRCSNPRNKRYANYGGRGIKMCAAWANSFQQFLDDMGPCPAGFTLERKRVDGDYEPGNCIWIAKAHQARNTTANVATMEIAREIRSRLAGGATIESLATEFGMSRANVSAIKANTTWKEGSP